MACGPCAKRRAMSIRQQTVPVQPKQTTTQNQSTATEQGNRLRGKMRFISR